MNWRGVVRDGSVLLGRINPWVFVTLAVIIAFGVQSCRVRQSQRAVADAVLRADSIRAVADTTRELSLRSIADSQRAFTRRVVQERQRADALDRELKQERLARVALTTRISGVDTVLQTDTIDSVHVRWARFSFYREPFAVEAEVSLPAPPGQGQLQLRVGIDPIPLHIRLGCGKTEPSGIRPAHVTVAGPQWATLSVDTVSQSSDLCRSPILAPKAKKRWPWFVAGVALGVVAWEIAR